MEEYVDYFQTLTMLERGLINAIRLKSREFS